VTVLGLETTSRRNSVAVWGDDGFLAQVTTRNYQNLCRRLPGLIDTVLREAEVTSYQALDGVAVSVGPGSFTGIRVGLSYARTMAQALGLPLASVPTLEAVAAQAPQCPGHTLALISCRLEQVYYQVFQVGLDGLHPVTEPSVASIQQVLSDWATTDPPIIWWGEGADVHRDTILQHTLSAATLSPLGQGFVTAATIARLGHQAILHGTSSDWRTVQPLYLLASAAERKAAANNVDKKQEPDALQRR